ncbi:hypothetical protein RYZ26_08540 [Terasakiella sp. A23]|uniref:hypothetical protein n=1 Tax=Terasakiella sp. FCG-A23 TaxID=3080561 RepID=UPI0029540D59|nr:hypothetical protein [Terasakiella sp. A23]MDV7339637.1 hypothetical protein [Terasakiella sp. A23]
MFFLYLYGSLILGFALAIIVVLDRYRTSEKSYRAVKSELSDLIHGDTSMLSTKVDDVITIFEKHDYALTGQTTEELTFQYAGMPEIEIWDWILWIFMLVTGGMFGLGLLFTTSLLEWLGMVKNQKVTLALTW